MAPKVKITREDIIRAAIEIVRRQGADAVNARTVATALSCSTQPVFSNFPTMEELRFSVREGAMEVYEAFLARAVEEGRYPAYKAQGMAYIRFAKEERELFQLLFMRDRREEAQSSEDESFDRMVAVVQQNSGLDYEKARLFHLEMWAFVHGIAAMFATNYLAPEEALVSDMITDAYMGLRKQYGLEA